MGDFGVLSQDDPVHCWEARTMTPFCLGGIFGEEMMRAKNFSNSERTMPAAAAVIRKEHRRDCVLILIFVDWTEILGAKNLDGTLLRFSLRQ
jgi:hypothetical protein